MLCQSAFENYELFNKSIGGLGGEEIAIEHPVELKSFVPCGVKLFICPVCCRSVKRGVLFVNYKV